MRGRGSILPSDSQLDDNPECLGCGETIALTAIYCSKCYRAIKLHCNPEPMPDTSGWSIEERGDRLGKWDEQCANCEDMSEISQMDCWKRWRAGLKYPAWYTPTRNAPGSD